VIVVVISVLVITWGSRVYHRKHRQDADLIKMLMERETTALMSLGELREATNNFSETTMVGMGGFGTVYTGKLRDGTTVAIKRSKREGSEQDKDQFLNEVRILSQVSHKNLVKLLGCCMENKTALLVFEFISNGTLQEYLQEETRTLCLPWKRRLRIAIQTADALNYLHCAATFPIFHRDVKSANILLDDDFNAKVSDFGISRLVPIEATHVSTVTVQGTLGYIDPEYYTTYQLTDKSDVYSFGVVLLELIFAKPAIDFQRGGENASLVKYAKQYIRSGDLEPVIDECLLETYNDKAGNGKESILHVGRLAMQCTQIQSKARPSMREILKELQNLWLDLQGSCHDWSSTTIDYLWQDPLPLTDSTHLFESCTTSSSSAYRDDSGIQMTQVAHLSRMRSMSNKW
jgi:serine/threonine protein kinase